MLVFNYQVKLYYKDATLKTVQENFVTEFSGTDALAALVASLRIRHEKDGELPEVGIVWMNLVC